jgi:ATP-dependent RNA helicase DeaD
MTHPSAPDIETASPKFSELNISPELKKGIKELGYLNPTAFQLSIFQSFQGGNNIIGEGQSNYGKSLAFSLPILAKINPEQKEPQALLVGDTSLQCDLMAKEYKNLGHYLAIDVATNIEGSNQSDYDAHILIMPASDVAKLDGKMLSHIHTIFLDNLTETHTKETIEWLHKSALDTKQMMVFGEDSIVYIKNHASHLFLDASFINNSDQPKIALPAKHIYHQAQEAQPKPRALLAALELHKPIFALVSCHETEESDLLARFLSRYGYRVRVINEQNRDNVDNALREGLAGAFQVLICQSSLLENEHLDAVCFMINYDMFDRPQSYENTTKFNKQAPGIQRMIVNIVTSREIGYLGPIKAQCLIDMVEMPLPSDDNVISLAANRIIDALNLEARDVELGQFEVLAQKIVADERSLAGMALLLRNHLVSPTIKPKRNDGDKEALPRDRRFSRGPQDRRRNMRPERFERPNRRSFESSPSSPNETPPDEAPVRGVSLPPEGITRLYVTLGKDDGFTDLASLAQYLSEKSGIDLGHFSGSGMVRDHSAHIEVDDQVAEEIITALHESPRPHAKEAINGHAEGVNLVVCEKARATAQRPYRKPMDRRRSNFRRRH